MLLSGNPQQMNIELEHILRGYRSFYHFNIRELQLIESLRTLRQIHYSAWLARRWEDPAFPISFPWFNTIRYWEDQLQDVYKQIDLLNT
jgi:Ser/Thr protein kinase RdoA (MazF antagonist)